MAAPEYIFYHPKTRKQWRLWLQKNHLVLSRVWFVYYKKESGKRRVSYDEAVEEALCFGWIDSLPLKIDEHRSALKFTPRKAKSIWSQLNKSRVEKLTQSGQMMPAGLAAVDRAKENGSWHSLTRSDNDAEQNRVPADLQKLFARNKKAKTNFEAFSMSIRKQFLSWIDSAKKPETRQARLQQTLLMAAANRKPGLKGFKL